MCSRQTGELCPAKSHVCGAVEVSTTSLFHCSASWKNLPYAIGDRRARLQEKQPRGLGPTFPRIYANSIPVNGSDYTSLLCPEHIAELIHIRKFNFL